MAKIINNADLTPEVLAGMSPDEIDWIYNGLDVCVTAEIYKKQQQEMDAVAKNTAAFSHALMAPIFDMSLHGTLIDEGARDKALNDPDEGYLILKNRLEKYITLIVEEGIGLKPFNYRSNKQLLKLFYGVLGLKAIRSRNTNGQYTPTVNRDAVEKLERYFSARLICRILLRLRELDKKINFLQTPLDADSRMRTTYNIAGTNTGRLASSESAFETGTNQQNIERLLRRIFIPSPGYKFCNIDLEQADARNVGAICWENFVESHGESFAGSYLDACESGDLHTAVCRMAWANLPWGTTPSNFREVADTIAYRELSYRDLAKKLGHGTNYYATPRTAASHTKVETAVIETFQRNYFAAFPVIGNFERSGGDNWHGWVRQQLNQFGYIKTPYFNRRRYFFGRPDDDRTLREAIAYAPQSMTADQIDTGILRLWRALPIVRLLIQVHDSILFEYPEHLEHEIIPQALELLTIKWRLKQGREFFVPLEAKVGWNWGDADERKQENLEGLMKWKGPGADTRKRPTRKPAYTRRTSMEAMLNGIL